MECIENQMWRRKEEENQRRRKELHSVIRTAPARITITAYTLSRLLRTTAKCTSGKKKSMRDVK